MAYHLHPATNDDKSWLDRLRRAAYRDLFDATFGGWDEERHARHFDTTWQRGHIKLIEVDGDRIGMIQVLEEPDQVEIAEIQISPDHQNKGIGSAVLSDAVSRAHHHGKPVVLSVGLKNQRAVRLYLRLGFRRSGRTETHELLSCPPAAPAGAGSGGRHQR